MREHLIIIFLHKFFISSEMESKKFFNSKSQQRKLKNKSNNFNRTRGWRQKGDGTVLTNLLELVVEADENK